MNFSKMLRPFSFSFALLLFSPSLSAVEGMWLPFLLGKTTAEEMNAMGMQMTAEDIYSVNNSSLKDAIVHFGGGCTAELISAQGLLLTNHHCGYGQIQSHSSLENDYLKDGFWAMNASQEKTNPGLTAAIVKYMEDVTEQVLAGVSEEMDGEARGVKIAENITAIVAAKEDDYDKEIVPFAFGNQYVLIAKEVFKDVRLVGAPPSSIGKFGADTDNWVWPRHTGDFSIFRVYANAENLPAEYAEDNVPYRPAQHLKVNIGGFEPGDFTMVYGFPGSTTSYLTSNEIENSVEIYNPRRKEVRDKLLEILDKKMRADDATRIKYASKYARISNSWKRWRGEILGIKRTDAIAKARLEEADFQNKVEANSQNFGHYKNLLPELKKLYDDRRESELERYIFLEVNYYGNEFFRHLLGYRSLLAMADDENVSDADLQKEGEKQAQRFANFYKDYDAELGQKMMQAVLPILLKNLPSEPIPDMLQELKNSDEENQMEFVAEMYEDAPMLNDPEKWQEMLNENPAKAAKKLRKSDAMEYTTASWDYFLNILNPISKKYQLEIDEKQGHYFRALSAVYPDKKLYPDANSTMRVGYGIVDGYEPADGVYYDDQTYLSGVVAKYVPGDYEFDLPEKLIDLYKEKDYGKYGEDGKMPVCFIASNHTTGGNSGSPVLNARGELIGLNFDRAWEGVMSDYHYDAAICRNIMVDLRYVLFIVDKFAGAGYLVEEMDLVEESPQSTVDSPQAVGDGELEMELVE